MTNSGFSEPQVSFQSFDNQALAGQVRRFGPHGPAYEVLSVRSTGDASIMVVGTGEQLDYPVTELLADPIAETVP